MAIENKHNDLYLFFPQWQGSGKTNELYVGATTLYQALKQQLSFTEVKVESTEELQMQRDIVGYTQIVRHLQEIHTLLLKRKPQRIFSIGGDCGIEVCPISFLNKQYKGDLAVIWLDAHPDANTPHSSPSHTFHGMVLRTLLGDGDSEIIAQAFSSLHSSQVFLAGIRDIDAPEAYFIREQGIMIFTCDQLTRTVESLIDAVQARGFTHVYLHLDVDILEPTSFAYLKHPTPNGLSFETLMRIREVLISRFSLVGSSIVEFTSPNNGSREIEQLAAMYLYPS